MYSLSNPNKRMWCERRCQGPAVARLFLPKLPPYSSWMLNTWIRLAAHFYVICMVESELCVWTSWKCTQIEEQKCQICLRFVFVCSRFLKPQCMELSRPLWLYIFMTYLADDSATSWRSCFCFLLLLCWKCTSIGDVCVSWNHYFSMNICLTAIVFHSGECHWLYNTLSFFPVFY